MAPAINSPKTDSDGFATAWILGFIFLIMVIGIFFYELGSIYNERQKLVNAADRAAAAGATAIDEVELVNNNMVVLDEAEAMDRCEQSLQKSVDDGAVLEVDISGACDANGDVMTVVAQADMRFGPIFRYLGVESKRFEITVQARPSCSDDPTIAGQCG